MRNRYAGKCFLCWAFVRAGEGYFQRNFGRDHVRPDLPDRWLVRCQQCVGKGNGGEDALGN